MPIPIEDWLTYFHCGITAARALAYPSQDLPQYSSSADKDYLAATIQQDLCWEQSSSHNHLISYEDERYPVLLKQTKGAPALLFVRGDPTLLRFPLFGIVGSRKPTREGVQNAAAFSSSLADYGICIVSGLAYGIDATAHINSLDKRGKTIAIIGTGIDITYPRAHHSLANKIVDNGGAIVSIFPRLMQPLKQNFPQRNRIISGVTLGLLVVEAGLASGAMITARLAAEQGREVFAIPGSIRSPLSEGTNKMIQDGANLTTNHQDIIKHLEPVYQSYGMAIKHQLAGSVGSAARNDAGGAAGNVAGGAAGNIAGSAAGSAKSSGGLFEGVASGAADELPGKLSDELPGKHSEGLPSVSQQILLVLDKGPLYADQLAELTKEPVSSINSALVELELSQLIYQENNLYHKTLGGV